MGDFQEITEALVQYANEDYCTHTFANCIMPLCIDEAYVMFDRVVHSLRSSRYGNAATTLRRNS